MERTRAPGEDQLHLPGAYSILQALGANRKERGLLTPGNKKINNGEEIMQLSEAILLPKDVEVIH